MGKNLKELKEGNSNQHILYAKRIYFLFLFSVTGFLCVILCSSGTHSVVKAGLELINPSLFVYCELGLKNVPSAHSKNLFSIKENTNKI